MFKMNNGGGLIENEWRLSKAAVYLLGVHVPFTAEVRSQNAGTSV